VSMTTTQKTAIFEQKDDLTEEHLIISWWTPQGVTKQGQLTGQTNGGAHDYVPDKKSDKMIPLSLASEGVSKWGQLAEETNRRVHQFTDDTPGIRQCGTPYQHELDSIQCFHIPFCICYHSVGEDHQILPREISVRIASLWTEI
jgi:hypothetical protein